jgi:hypothetical protein
VFARRGKRSPSSADRPTIEEVPVGIGAGIVLLALGAVLTFAVHVSTSGFNLHTVGIILMLAGALGIVIDLVLLMPRRRRMVTTDRYAADPAVRRTVYDERA